MWNQSIFDFSPDKFRRSTIPEKKGRGIDEVIRAGEMKANTIIQRAKATIKHWIERITYISYNTRQFDAYVSCFLLLLLSYAYNDSVH